LTGATNNSDTAVLFITSDKLGEGADELSHLLMGKFIYSLANVDDLPQTILFMNSGVKLCTEGSEVIDDLKSLQKNGVELLACGTCLDYYQLNDSLKIGEVTNMYDVVEHLTESAKVITV